MSGKGSLNYWRRVEPDSRDSVTRIAETCEKQGVFGVFVPQSLAPPWPSLGALSAMSPELHIASGIALAFARSPFETAAAALELDRISGGRFILGLGTSVRHWNEDFFGVAYDRPVSRLREVVMIVRAIIEEGHKGDIGQLGGDFYRLNLDDARISAPTAGRIPIWIAALRSKLVRLSGGCADGLMGHPIWSTRWLERQIREELLPSLEESGRSRSDFHVNAWIRVAISDDVEAATQDAKPSTAFYAGLSQYESYFAAHGFGNEASLIRERSARGASPRELADAVPDEMAQEFVMVGPADEVIDRVHRLDAVVDSVCLDPPSGIAPERAAEYEDAIAESFYV